MKYNCPICKSKMYELKFFKRSSYYCKCLLAKNEKSLDDTILKDARIAELEKELDSKDAHIAELKKRIDSFTHEISGGGWLCDQ